MRPILIILFCIANLAALSRNAQAYENGLRICRDLSVAESGSWVSTRVYPHRSDSDSTKIYYHFLENYDARKPTLLFFPGGPGEGSHYGNKSVFYQFLKALNFNILLFDYRGIACSRPDAESLYKSWDFYNNENSAHDAKAILDHLHLQKVYVLGHSYGTTVATIFASLFPSRVSSVTLFGTVGKDRLPEAIAENNEFRRDLIERTFKSLPRAIQSRFISWLDGDDARPAEYSFGYHAAILHGGKYTLDLWHQYLIDNPGDLQPSNYLQSLHVDEPPHHLSNRSWFAAAESYFYDFTNYMRLDCRFFSEQTAFGEPTNFILRQDFSFEIGSQPRMYCELPPRPLPAFDARHWPIHVPVTYIAGVFDSFTSYNQSVYHFARSAKARATLVELPKNGHTPMNEITNTYATQIMPLVSLFRSSFTASGITNDDASRFSRRGYFQARIAQVKN